MDRRHLICFRTSLTVRLVWRAEMLPDAQGSVRTLTVNVMFLRVDSAKILAYNSHHSQGNSHSAASELKSKGLFSPAVCFR
jgi:hypothetical protein